MKILIIGMGISGRGAARLLLSQGHYVAAVDQKPFEMEGVQPLSERDTFDLVVLSPGIPPSHPATQKGELVIGEAELGFRNLKNRCIGITGTNGKTTLTLLITHVLNSVGIKSCALGNVGASVSEYAVNGDPEEVVVAELSSFQLETMSTPIFDYGVITTITPDHLDRYPSFLAYAQTKCFLGNLVKKQLVVSREVEQEYGAWLPKEKLRIVNIDSYLQLTEKDRYWEQIGYDKAAYAFTICENFGISWEAFREACRSFQKPNHRLEYVCAIKGVRFYNDSKGTNAEAVLYALRHIVGPLYLIAGGISKKESFEIWKRACPGKVKQILAIGETAEQIEKELKCVVPVSRFQTLREAVRFGYEIAEQGEAVLLSPGCASFDQFLSYEDRGNKFKEYVEELRG